MSESEKQPPKNSQKALDTQQESEDLSRSPGVTDRELLSRENSSEVEEIKQSNQQSQNKNAKT